MAAKKEILNLVDGFLVAEATEYIRMEVHLLGAHAAYVEGQCWAQAVVGALEVVVDRNGDRGQDLKVFGGAARRRASESFAQVGAIEFFVLWGIKNGEPTVGDLGSEGHVLRSFGTQEDG